MNRAERLRNAIDGYAYNWLPEADMLLLNERARLVCRRDSVDKNELILSDREGISLVSSEAGVECYEAHLYLPAGVQ
jgi:hypothetical protein